MPISRTSMPKQIEGQLRGARKIKKKKPLRKKPKV